MSTLQQLVGQARALANDHPCKAHGHAWQSIGGRVCPHPDEVGSGRCSQTVYECERCGLVDYGERGGPGAADCVASCRYADRRDPFFASLTSEHAAQGGEHG